MELQTQSETQSQTQTQIQYISLCNKKPTILAFTSKTCGACIAWKPQAQQLIQTSGSGGYHFIQIDIQDPKINASKIMTQFGIQYYPTIVYYSPSLDTFYLEERGRDASVLTQNATNKIGILTRGGLSTTSFPVWTRFTDKKGNIYQVKTCEECQ
jgi:predicted secreted protein